MSAIQTLQEFRELLQAGFDNDEKSLGRFNRVDSTQLKAYLIESNLDLEKKQDALVASGKDLKILIGMYLGAANTLILYFSIKVGGEFGSCIAWFMPTRPKCSSMVGSRRRKDLIDVGCLAPNYYIYQESVAAG